MIMSALLRSVLSASISSWLSENGRGPPRTDEMQAHDVCVFADLKDGTSTVLVSGNDFYSNPALSQDGSKLAWVTWNHPNM